MESPFPEELDQTYLVPELGWLRKAAVAGLCVLALAGCTESGRDDDLPSTEQGAVRLLPEFDVAHERDLLAANWHYVQGVVVAGRTLTVTHTGGAILTTPPENEKTARPAYDPNPPVVLYGPHVEMSQAGNVGFAARLTDIKGRATISLLSGPTIRFDERVEQQPGVDITIDGNVAGVVVRGNKKATQTEVKLGHAVQTADVAVAQTHDSLKVAVNGHTVTIRKTVFDKQVWLGFDAAERFSITGYNLYPVAGNQVRVVDTSEAGYVTASPSPNGLASIAAAHGHGDKLLGTAVDLVQLLADPNYAAFVVQNFNEIETETLAKFQALQPERGQFQFAELDALVRFANEHNLTVHGHALVFGEAYPQWLYDALARGSKQDALDIMRTHIQTVMSRYDGKHGHGTINYWDVVNEPFDPDEWGQLNMHNLWYRAIGREYILEAFKAAREANPQAMLGLNEWGIETDADRRNAVIGLIRSLPPRTIDFVGLQAHFDEDTLDDEGVMDGIYSGDLPKIFAQFAAAGVNVRISEASVAENGDTEAQSDVYRMLLEACMKAPNCIGFNLWGATSNRYYFTTTPKGGTGDDAPTKQDARGVIVERPAMQGLREGAAA